MSKSKEEKKIIYSLKIMRRLVEGGNIPEAIMPNPTNPRYNCWIFNLDEKLQRELDEIFGEKYEGNG